VAHLFWQCAPGATAHDPICPLAADAPGTVTWAGTVDILSNAAGSATFQYEATLAGAGSGVSPQCNAHLWSSSAFTGLCPMTSHGKGYFTQEGLNAPYFGFSDEWVTFHGTKVVRDVHNPMAVVFLYPALWPIPAVPGYYHDKLPGVAPETGGVHIEEVVARY
jgi:hypothetical protein